ncbi:preprotein translocase subunit SecA [Rhodopirellula sp. JC740]|uniref:Preprotein translocase subunit SecA n=1 Tax=Rhodopirellula halodulae TaxID=2894198 RepID=A0ABS8NI05_9BACT|nr:preprotein translocase subunit SecA [Rhodopirellula sp. JC740]MCC9643186.1 preprotein translocase subunit SecA [Rhodopirellula sp. JC740]
MMASLTQSWFPQFKRVAFGSQPKEFTIDDLLVQIHSRGQRWRSASDEDLAGGLSNIRYDWLRRNASDSGSSVTEIWRTCLIDSVAIASEAIRRTHKIELFEVQLRAGLIVSSGIANGRGGVAEMQTGEGKTFAMFVAAVIAAIPGRGVHLATPSAYLAARDHQQLELTWNLLQLTSGCLPEDASAEQTRAAYRADVTYGPGHAFGFDYLKDQLALGTKMRRRPGASLLSRLQMDAQADTQLQRGLAVALIDEIDHVLIDDALSPLLLSGTHPGEVDDAEVHRRAIPIASELKETRDFRCVAKRVELNSDGLDRVYQSVDAVSDASLHRPWHEYIELALQAQHLLHRDADYVVESDEVRIVDPSTGRIYEDRTWSGGLQQAVEAKEGLPIRRESEALAKITRQRFYRSYDYLAGVTGTASDCRDELRTVYGLKVQTVNPRLPSQRVMLSPHVSPTQADKLRAIAAEARAMIDAGRSVLIGTLDIASSLAVSKELSKHGLQHELLNGLQTADEAEVVASAGQPGAITVATNIAGRGTDIGLHPTVREQGGLHVIVAEHHRSSRVDRQLIGRCARCGDPGSSRAFLSADDPMIRDSAPWLARALTRAIASGQTATQPKTTLPVEEQIQSIQRHHAKRAAVARQQLLAADERDCVLVRKAQSNRNANVQLHAMDAAI